MLNNYYGIGHDSLDNYTAEISGQSGNYELNEDCGIYAPFVQFGGENFDKFTKYGQLSGEGCLFPQYINTIAGQLTAKHLSWREYAQDMGNNPHRDGTVMTQTARRAGTRRSAATTSRIDRTSERQQRNAAQPVHVLPFGDLELVLLRRARALARSAVA